ncbi:unnamed protein product [Phaeothamnion confervicola]
MRETLVNYKRDELVDHKVQTARLREEMEALAKDRESLESQVDAVRREVAGLEASATEAEGEARSHARHSIIGPDGRVSAAHQRKRRRLEEELEAFLAALDRKKADAAALDDRLRAVEDARHEREDEMKELERSLVEVLVEQQKKLLAALADDHVENQTAFDQVRDARKRWHGSAAIAAATVAAGGGTAGAERPEEMNQTPGPVHLQSQYSQPGRGRGSGSTGVGVGRLGRKRDADADAIGDGSKIDTNVTVSSSHSVK